MTMIEDRCVDRGVDAETWVIEQVQERAAAAVADELGVNLSLLLRWLRLRRWVYDDVNHRWVRVSDLRDPDAKVTAMHRRIVAFVEQYHQQNGYAPSVREVSAGVGLAAHSVTLAHLEQMRALGLVEWTRYKSRTLRVVS